MRMNGYNLFSPAVINDGENAVPSLFRRISW